MGAHGARAFAEQVEEGNVDLSGALEWHLKSNHYPPLPYALVATAEEAIDKANDGDWDAEITMPEGIQFRHEDTATVSLIVETMHLDEFLNPEEYIRE